MLETCLVGVPCYIYRVEKAIKWIQRGYAALFALLPWSSECSFGSWKLDVPGEPLTALLGLALGWVVLKKPSLLRSAFSGHLLLKISAVWIGWLAFCISTSSIPVVSFKYWVVETGHWWVFAVGMAVFPGLFRKVLPFFAVSMAGMAVYTLIRHAGLHFRVDQAMLAPMPFFPENNMYAAVLAMTIFSCLPFRHSVSGPVRFVFGLLLPTGLFFSFSRTAWASVVVATGICLLLRRKMPRSFFIAGAILLCLGGLFFRKTICTALLHDVSLQERLNRYSCALRMAYDRPWVGFGPGTYQFQYFPYQRPEEMTRISVTEPVKEHSVHTLGRGGGAHSEYFQALTETGLPGLILFLALLAAVMWKGLRFGLWGMSKDHREFVFLLTLALLTFFLHGFLNNFLHDGRVAALFWGAAVAVGSSSGSRQ
ncbi:MAG: O-antigen ligase family protein [Saprospiraceae bacterium]|nr:O-antigen ligase family protein [Saprospiraceae bacterium]